MSRCSISRPIKAAILSLLAAANFIAALPAQAVPTGVAPSPPLFSTEALAMREKWLAAASAGSAWNDTTAIDVFVDSAGGNDSNPGTLALPRATLAGITQAPGLVIGLKRGSVFREHLTVAQDGVKVVAYGSPSANAPVLLNATKITGTWTNTSGNIWSISLATAPDTVLLISAYNPSGVTKLWKYATTQTAPASGQFGYSGGTLYVYSTVNPGTLAEVGYTVNTLNTSGIGVQINANNVLLQDIAVWGSGSDGVYCGNGFTGDNVRGVNSAYNTGDGVGGLSNKAFLGEYNLITDNGYGPRDGTSSDGDGFSFHGNADTSYAQGVIRYNTILRNRKSGIGNQTSAVFDGYGNYIDNNYDNIAMFNVAYTGSVPIINRFWNNIVINRANDDHGSAIPQAPSYATDTQFYNNTFFAFAKVTGKAGFRGVESALASVTWENNIVYGYDRGFDVRASTNLTMDYNLFFANTQTYFDAGSGYLTGKTGSHSAIADPNFVDPTNGILNLRATSVGRGAGLSIPAITTETFRRSAAGTPPNIGAL